MCPEIRRSIVGWLGSSARLGLFRSGVAFQSIGDLLETLERSVRGIMSRFIILAIHSGGKVSF